MNCFIFDIDGTLIDTAAVDRESFSQALKEFGYPFEPDELYFAFGMTGEDALEHLAIKPELRAPLTQRWEVLAYNELDKVQVYDGIAETINTLRKAGNKCGIVTARTRRQLEDGFTPLGLNGWFDAIVCADEVGKPKPAPDELTECIRRLGGTRDSTIYIGDSTYDMQCARSAGVRGALALWGCHDPDRIQADIRLKHPSELLML